MGLFFHENIAYDNGHGHDEEICSLGRLYRGLDAV